MKLGRVGAGIGPSPSGGAGSSGSDVLSGGETSDDGGSGLGGGGLSAAEIKWAKAAARAADDDPGLRPEGMPAEVYVSLRALEAEMAAGDGTGLSAGGEAGKGAAFSVADALEWLRRNAERISAKYGGGGSSSSSSSFPVTAEERLDALAAARFVAPPYGATAQASSSSDETSSSTAPATASSAFLTTAVSTFPADTKLLLSRRAPPAKPPLPLNARVSWLGPARPAPLVASGMRTRILALYDAHLADDGKGVDYAGLLADARFADFCCAAAELQALGLADLEALPAAERAALFINVYNAMIVHATAERGAPADSPAARAAFFGSAGGAAYSVAGFAFTADDVEHGVLRCNAPSVGSVGGALRLPWATHFPRGDARAALALPRLDARVHAALNCGARSCPPIKVYAASSLSEALDGAMCALCGDARVDERARTVELSMIFKVRIVFFSLSLSSFFSRSSLSFIAFLSHFSLSPSLSLFRKKKLLSSGTRATSRPRARRRCCRGWRATCRRLRRQRWVGCSGTVARRPRSSTRLTTGRATTGRAEEEEEEEVPFEFLKHTPNFELSMVFFF